MCIGLLNGQKASSLHAGCVALKMLGKSHMKPQDLSFLLFHHNVEDSQRLVTCSLWDTDVPLVSVSLLRSTWSLDFPTKSTKVTNRELTNLYS